MMELETAIKHAIDGKAILFLGAGFSIEGINQNDECFPLAPTLSEKLCKEMGKPNNSNLTIISDMFITKRGSKALIDLLQRTFRLKNCGGKESVYQSILGLPWKRIYTTNYDDLCEKTLSAMGTVAIPKTISDVPKDAQSDLTVLHINGYIDKLTPDTLQSEFKLSADSYLVDNFLKSDWSLLFREELNSSQAVIFIGVSFNYDIDLQRIISNSAAFQNKIVFIDKPLAPEDDVETINYYKQKFGTVYNIGIDQFAREIVKINQTYKRFTVPSKLTSFEKAVFDTSEPQECKSLDSRYLLQYGTIEPAFIPFTLDNNEYIVCRSAEDNLIDELNRLNGPDCIVVTSELAGGKTCLMYRIAYRLQEKGEVYYLNNYNNATFEELKSIVATEGKKYIIIENYNYHYPALKLFRHFNLKSSQVQLILTARTTINETTSHNISSFTGLKNESICEVNLDKLTDKDIERLIDLLDRAGEIDSLRNKTKAYKVAIIKKRYESRLLNILLALIKSKHVSDEIQKLCDEIIKSKAASEIMIGACISSLVNLDLSLNDILNILELHLTQSLKENTSLRQIVDFQSDYINLRSSALSEYLIRMPQFNNIVRDILVRFNLNAELCGNNNKVATMRNALISASNIALLFPINDSTSPNYIIEYYSKIKQLSFYKNNQFFWLQFAMACMDIKDYKRANDYLDISYGIVSNKAIQFDTYQMDTQKARYYLEYAIFCGEANLAFSNLTQAHDKLISVIRRKRGQNHLVFKQVRKYKDVYETFGRAFSNKERQRLLRFVREFIDACNSYLSNPCTEAQRRITEETLEILNSLTETINMDIVESFPS